MVLACFAHVLLVFAHVLLNFQAVIKSAASAASPTAWGAPDDGARWDDGVGRTTERIRTTARGAPQAVGEAASSSRLDHGLKLELDPYIKGPKRQFFDPSDSQPHYVG